MLTAEALIPANDTATLERASRSSLPALPWRDVHNVPKEELTSFIARLERACLEHPDSADLRTCLGMARAMNLEVYKSIDALEEARTIDPTNFWAQMKYAELQYRLRVLNLAEPETRRAMDLAENPMQLALARRQLQEIRRFAREGARNVHWTKPLTAPAIALSVMLVVVFAAMLWR